MYILFFSIICWDFFKIFLYFYNKNASFIKIYYYKKIFTECKNSSSHFKESFPLFSLSFQALQFFAIDLIIIKREEVFSFKQEKEQQ